MYAKLSLICGLCTSTFTFGTVQKQQAIRRNGILHVVSLYIPEVS